MCIHVWKFPEKCKINAFKHSDLTNQYSSWVFAFIVSTEFNTRKNGESFTNLQNIKVLTISNNCIFQEISKADQIFHFKWKVQGLKSNLNFEISSISTTSIFLSAKFEPL